ncbi:peptide/nickel transport system ATP-binding protein [Nocardioides terrae]|uniref:Peptide/nickel transport system ATP-binding protein n=1 Tax=Nocardioides terrae TaxID=574651 RepID=A0A1I1KEK1_9ACTN|nr:ABC transporter ATP-binding protein [Nocardioides terrae]SFC59229.1 peptide/nickel transport system ATP-binding protein [Nocardioides terrae]
MTATSLDLDGATRPRGDVALDVENLSVDIRTPFGTVRAVDSVSFTARRGETVALLGESGCGKSLTATSIVGLVDPVVDIADGAIRLDGEDLIGMSPKRRRAAAGPELAIVFQDALTALNPVYTVGTQLAEPFRIHRGLSRKEARAEAIRLMERVGIPEPESRVDSYPHQFSGGMRQRLLIAIAVALSPAVLLADEPTTALDVTVQAQIMKLLRDLREERDMAVVLITHDLALVAEQADRVVVMYAGNVVESGPVDAVFSTPKHPYTKGLLESVPVAAERGADLKSIGGAPPELSAIPSACVYQDRCPLVRDICRTDRPPLREVAEDHAAACHFSEEVSR